MTNGTRPRPPQRDRAPVIIGAAATGLSTPLDAAPDEVLFECVADALRDAGTRKQDVDLSVVASLDLYDGCSMSNSFTVGAAAGWLTGEYRIAADSGMALVCAAAAVVCGDADVVVLAGLHQPQSPDGDGRLFDEQVSSLSFDPQYERPVGMTGINLLALHASRAVTSGATTIAALANVAAEEIRRGATSGRTSRDAPPSADAVLSSAPVAWPLTELMLPAQSRGAVALILAAPQRALSSPRARAKLVGCGVAGGATSTSSEWLIAPERAAAAAAAAAYKAAGIDDPLGELRVAEVTSPTPALLGPLLTALRIEGMPADRVSPSGGVRSCYPGAANGALRVLQAIEWLERNGSAGDRAVAHSTETVTGPVAANTSVCVVERA